RPIDRLWENRMGELLPGTLEMLILKTLDRGSMHGHGIAKKLHERTEDVLRVEEGSLYPALQRLLAQGFVKAEWGESENKRRARYYQLTAAGRKQLDREISRFERLVQAIGRIIRPA